MKKSTLISFVAASILTISFSSSAHDPKMHMKKPEKANCAPLEKMKKENKKMDMTDPIMIAMMNKCEKQTQSAMKNHKENQSENMSHEKMQHDKMNKKDAVEKKHEDDHKH